MTYRLFLSADQLGFIQLSLQSVLQIVNTVLSIVMMRSGASIHVVKLMTSLLFTLQPIVYTVAARKFYRIDRGIALTEEPLKQKWNGLAQHVASVVLGNADTVILTLFSTLENVSVYGIYHLVVNGVKQIVVSLTSGIQALLGNMLAKKEEKALQSTFSAFEWGMHTVVTIAFTVTGLLILPCELIERNGDILRDTVLRHAADWALGEDFAAWVNTACSFRNTLVDRIVSGAPTVGENPGLAWEDDLVNTSEYFHLFIIEGQEDARLPFARIGLNIKWVESVEAWRTVKVRILNGAHTSMIPYAMLLGIETVGDCLRDARTRAHLDACLVQILRSMDGDEAENRAYAAQVLTRFENPYIRHLCAAISLNSVSKFRVRVLPSILAYREKTGESPEHLLFALCMLIRFYREGNPNDSASVIETFRTRTVPELLADADIWGVSLTEYAEEVARYADTSL